MDLAKVMETLVEVLVEIQKDKGRPVPEQIDQNSCPFSDFAGFDSLNSVEAAFDLSERFECNIPNDVFLPKPRQKVLTIGDIAVRIHQIINLGA